MGLRGGSGCPRIWGCSCRHGDPCPAGRRPDLALRSQRLSLLLLLLLPGPPPALGMEDAAFPHPGESSQPPPRACPLRCSCPRDDTVDCDGLDLQVFPDNITRAAQHLSLQVGPTGGGGQESAGLRVMGCGAHGQGGVSALMQVGLDESAGVCVPGASGVGDADVRIVGAEVGGCRDQRPGASAGHLGSTVSVRRCWGSTSRQSWACLGSG